jgi:exonuclease SbcC
MLLHSLRMRNFKRYRDQAVHFHDGITGIVGNNGTGKSTIVDAILFALYGVQGTGIDSEFLVSAFSGPREKAEVTLDFSIGGEDYLIQRAFGRKAGSSHTVRLYKGDINRKNKLLAKDVLPVQEKIHRLLRMGPADFRHTIFSGQKDLSALLDTNREKRKAWFRKVLGIDFLKDDGGKILREERETLAARRERLVGILEGIGPDIVRERLDAVCREIQSAEDLEASLKRRALTLESRIPDLESRIRDLEEAQGRHTLLTGELNHLRTESHHLRREREALDREIADLTGKVKEYQDLQARESAFGESRAALEEMRRRGTVQERLAEQGEAAGARLKELEIQLATTAEDLARIREDEGTLLEIAPRVARRGEVLALLQLQEACDEKYRVFREEFLRVEHDLEGARLRGTEIRDRIEETVHDQERLGALERELSDDGELREKSARLSRARELDLQQESIRCQAGNAKTEITQLKESIRDLERSVAGTEEVNAAIKRLEKERAAVEQGLASTAAAMDTRAKEAGDAEQHLAALRDLGPDSPCPTCHQPLRDHYGPLLQELEEGRETAREAQRGLEAEQSRLLGERDRIARELTAMAARKDLQQQQEGEHRTQAARLKARTGDLQRLEKEAEEFGDAIRALGMERYDPAEHRGVQEEMESREEKRAEAARLRQACARMPALRAEWNALEERTLQTMNRREEIDREIRALGFDPALTRELGRERDALEEPWRTSLALTERVRRKGTLLEYQRTLDRNHEEARRARDDLLGRLASVRYDRDLHRTLEEAFRQAQADHERFLSLSPLVAMLPDREERLERTLADLAEAERELAGRENQIAGLAFHKPDLAAALAEWEEVQREIRRTGISLERCQGDLRRLGEQRTGLEGSLAQAEEVSREIGGIKRQMELLDLTRDLIGQFTDHLLGVVRDRIQDDTSRILSDITDGRYDTVLIDDDLTLLVHDLGGDFPAGRFSGGEQDDIAVALRIALSRYLAEMHGIQDPTFLIFDEIFGSQDEERRSNLFRALRTQEAHFPQIFLISHIPDVQGEFSNLLVVEAGPDGASTVRSPDDDG